MPQTPMFRDESEPHYAGGIVINKTNPSIVYLARPVNGDFEIVRWSTGDKGLNWSASSIKRSSDDDNLRPVFPL
jgi:hypothetical protein